MKLKLFLFFVAIGTLIHTQAQEMSSITGPVIKDYGPVFEIPETDFPTDPDRMYMAVFDISQSSSAPDQVNQLINGLARFLNMHVQAGVPRENIRLAAVFHGGAAKDTFNSQAYRERFQVDNPNEELLRQLAGAGVRLYICGQSMGARDMGYDEICEPVGIALSAMTVLVTLQSEGYQLIRF